MSSTHTEMKLKISFNTPAFLGNADQCAQWRTPPFKAALRQWWRVVKAKELGYNHVELRKAESKLFGFAADESIKGAKSLKTARSLLRLRLNTWAQSGATQLPVRASKRFNPALYLGYGAVNSRSFIQPNQAAELWLGFPAEYTNEIAKAIQLMAWFGAVGNRSRNGFGSINIEPISGIELKPLTAEALKPYLREFKSALEIEWPHCIGKDVKGPLVWKLSCSNSCDEAISKLANLKKDYRTSLKQAFGNNFYPIVAFPVLKKPCNYADANTRNPNQLRFKVMRSDRGLVGLAFHMPCTVADCFFKSPKNINKDKEFFKKTAQKVWPKLHSFLDKQLERIR